MTKLIGIKELQTNTKKAARKPPKESVFEINPVGKNVEFAGNLESTGLYTGEFVKKMKSAEKDVKEKRTHTFNSTEEFLKSLA